MSAWRPRGRRVWETNVPTRAGVWLKRSTGTRDRLEARQVDRMLSYLGPRPAGVEAWDLLEMVTEDRWPLAELWTRWREVPLIEDPSAELGVRAPTEVERLSHLRAVISDVDLRPLVDAFHAVLAGPSGDVGADTAAHYRAAVRTLIGRPDAGDAPFYRSQLTSDALRAWVEGMQGVSAATVRKRGMGMRRFTAWLVAKRILRVDPMVHIPLPSAGPPLCHFLETEDAIRLADAQSGLYRLYSAFLAGTAIEVMTALGVRVRQVSRQDREIRAPGTKSHARDRIVRVAEWAWPAVVELLQGKHPDARLFEGIPDRWVARDRHAEAVAALSARGHLIFTTPKPYTMRDQRHTWAVRAVRSGMPIEMVSRQLGHATPVLALTVYGRFVPRQDERDRWERIAAARDAERGASVLELRREVHGG